MENQTGILFHQTDKGMGYIVADSDGSRVYVRAASFAPNFPYHKLLSAPHGIRATYHLEDVRGTDTAWAIDVTIVGEPL